MSFRSALRPLLATDSEDLTQTPSDPRLSSLLLNDMPASPSCVLSDAQEKREGCLHMLPRQSSDAHALQEVGLDSPRPKKSKRPSTRRARRATDPTKSTVQPTSGPSPPVALSSPSLQKRQAKSPTDRYDDFFPIVSTLPEHLLSGEALRARQAVEGAGRLRAQVVSRWNRDHPDAAGWGGGYKRARGEGATSARKRTKLEPLRCMHDRCPTFFDSVSFGGVQSPTGAYSPPLVPTARGSRSSSSLAFTPSFGQPFHLLQEVSSCVVYRFIRDGG